MTPPQTATNQHKKEVFLFLEETFQTHHGIYLDKGTSFIKSLRGEQVGKVNWREIWESDRTVTPDEWSALVARLREEYAKVGRLHADPATWDREDALGEFTAIAIHTAYHLGAVRQALAVIRSRASA